jgi:hypothetical protein
MTGDADESTIRNATLCPCFFNGSYLRSNHKNTVKGRGQNIDVPGHIKVVIDFIFPVEI